MHILFRLLLLICLNLCEVSSNNTAACGIQGECPNVKTPLSLIRKRRHLSFPKGGSVVLTISLVKAFMVHAPSGWNIALEIDVFYHLPDDEFVHKHLRKKLRHRQRREFWEKLQDALDFHNLNGRACIMRGVCEARTRLAPRGRSLVHDILRAIFTVPYQGEDEAVEFTEEMEPHYHPLRDPHFCDQYSSETDCPVSILDFVLSLNKQG